MNIIDIRGKEGDTRFECPVCHWSITLSPEGVRSWTRNGEIKPKCRKDKIALTQTIIEAK